MTSRRTTRARRGISLAPTGRPNSRSSRFHLRGQWPPSGHLASNRAIRRLRRPPLFVAIRHGGPRPPFVTHAAGRRAARQTLLTAARLDGRTALLLLARAVFAAPALAPADALRVERAANDVIAHARQILDAAAAHQHDAVLLQAVTLARNVGRDLDAVAEPHARHFAQRGVRLLRRDGAHLHADAPLLRRAVAAPRAVRQRVVGEAEGRSLRLLHRFLSALAHQLADRGQRTVSSKSQ